MVPEHVHMPSKHQPQLMWLSNTLSRTQSLSEAAGQPDPCRTTEFPSLTVPYPKGDLSRCNSLPHTIAASSNISTRRGLVLDLSLPTNFALHAAKTAERSSNEICPEDSTGRAGERALQTYYLHVSPSILNDHTMTWRLPTPPEELDHIDWQTVDSSSPYTRHGHSSHNASLPGVVAGGEESVASSSSLIAGANAGSILSHMLQCPEWLIQTCQALVTQISILDAGIDNIEMLSQLLPSQAQDLRTKPTFELIYDLMQQRRSSSLYMTITHAVAQSRISGEFPRSPPVTPMRPSEDDYFGDQTVFTNASVIPTYHSHTMSSIPESLPLLHHVMAPSKADIVVLERFIPPSTSAEISDLFCADSGKSYLADRLPELSSRHGTMLFIYPTKQGGRTFADAYLGPVLDPILREQSVLYGLNTYAAESIGRLSAVESMLDFGEIQQRVHRLCEQMTQKSRQRFPRSAYAVVQSSSGQIVVDHQTWVSWFIEQEQDRVKQNLVEYQYRNPGKIASSSRPYDDLSETRRNDDSEPTITTFARDIIGNLRKSRCHSPEVGIEVGCFIIQRKSTF